MVPNDGVLVFARHETIWAVECFEDFEPLDSKSFISGNVWVLFAKAKIVDVCTDLWLERSLYRQSRVLELHVGENVGWEDNYSAGGAYQNFINHVGNYPNALKRGSVEELIGQLVQVLA